MKVSEDVRRADVLGGAWHQAETTRQQRPRLDSGEVQVAEVSEREPRSWWAFEMMRPEFAQAFAVIGGIITPTLVSLFGVLMLFAETSTPAELGAKIGLSLCMLVSAACLFLAAVYALVETNGLSESKVETASNGARGAASIATVIGGMVVLAFFFHVIFLILALVAAVGALIDE